MDEWSKQAYNALEDIYYLAIDYDGLHKASDLRGLIDDLRGMAWEGLHGKYKYVSSKEFFLSLEKERKRRQKWWWRIEDWYLKMMKKEE